jgi:hypothetical protein
VYRAEKSGRQLNTRPTVTEEGKKVLFAQTAR